jgi:GH15 family glucan-1,4-alpha-glucosidase
MNGHQYRMGIVGNCSYLAYINDRGTVNWLCWPRFDSSFVFGRLLDEQRGGEFTVIPEGDFVSRQYYMANTNILCTEFECADGKFRVIDCAPRFNQYERVFRPLMLIRKIELLAGMPVIRVKCDPTLNYGAARPTRVDASNHMLFQGYPTQLRLTTDVSLSHIADEKPFVLTQSRYLVLTYGEPLEAPLKSTADDFIDKTFRYWQGWIKGTYVPDIYQEVVIRSALVLKLHQYEDTGGIIASGTTSLPEHNNSNRTWDYRYCWFRDSYYTLKAFNELGHFEELEMYFQYIEDVLMRDKDRMQPLYSITCEKELHEHHLDLSGYLGNQPVRVGNDAYRQTQNDVYGQVLVGLLPLFVDRRLSFSGRSSYKPLADRLLTWIERTMDEPDAGLWEFRNVRQVHTYTLLFHWAGAKAAAKLGRHVGDAALNERAERIAIMAQTRIEQCYDPKQKVYTQAVGAEYLDASTLKMITMNYLDPSSEKARQHLAALEGSLKTDQGLFYRYVHQDDFGKPQATILICAFWYADALACVGRVDDARRTLDNILSFANSLHIFSEDVGLDGSQWGNYPQTYSHVGLINAVFRISKKLDQPNFK